MPDNFLKFRDVAAACISIAAQGSRPTVQAVRAILGGGHHGVVLEMIHLWKDSQQSAAELEAAERNLRELRRAVDSCALRLVGIEQLLGVTSASARMVREAREHLEGTIPASSTPPIERNDVGQRN